MDTVQTIEHTAEALLSAILNSAIILTTPRTLILLLYPMTIVITIFFFFTASCSLECSFSHDSLNSVIFIKHLCKLLFKEKTIHEWA